MKMSVSMASVLWTLVAVSQVLVIAQPSVPGSSYAESGILSDIRGRGTSAGSTSPSGQQGGTSSGDSTVRGAVLGSGQVGINVGKVSGGGPSGTFGQAGSGPRVTAGSSSGPASYAGPRYGSPQVTRVDAVFHPTVTQLVTVDRFVTLTDQAFQSVAVTLTSLTVQTVTTGTRGVLQTPVDDRVALQTTVLYKTSTLTVTHVQSDFRIVTERSLDYVTIAHTSYIIVQTTYTTTATQVLSYTTTLVRTNINTKSTAFTDYRTITDTVLVPGGYYGFRQS
ncbi:uncharacterized protein [Procambarus clarkii]|uniref:uncharacterized protein n=1 Tax=Procambarus clarkii TaxID=6728 RepID=UPI003743B9C1